MSDTARVDRTGARKTYRELLQQRPQADYLDDLLHGEDPEAYRIGRRTDDPSRASEQAIPLLGDAASDLRIDLVRLEAREAGGPSEQQTGRGIVAVANGLVQVQIA